MKNYKWQKISQLELAGVCNMSRITVYKYVSLLEN